MGHLVAKDVYGSLGQKIDNLSVRTPQTETFCSLLREIYTPEEAELIVRMPFALSSLERIAEVTRRDPAELEPRLAALCDKGLVVDLLLGDRQGRTCCGCDAQKSAPPRARQAEACPWRDPAPQTTLRHLRHRARAARRGSAAGPVGLKRGTARMESAYSVPDPVPAQRSGGRRK